MITEFRKKDSNISTCAKCDFWVKSDEESCPRCGSQLDRDPAVGLSPTYRLSPNLKLFLIIFSAIVVALAAFTIGKSLWDKHEADVAQEQAREQEAARVAREKIGQLSSIKDDATHIQTDAIDSLQQGVDACNEHTSKTPEQAASCDDAQRRIAIDKDLVKQKQDQYNQLANTVPQEFLDQAGLPVKLP